MSKYDVLVIGAGPAGLFACHRLSREDVNVLVIEEGSSIEDRRCPRLEDGVCHDCTPCSIMCGLGGSGLYSDGTLNLRHDVGGDLTDFVDEEKAQNLVEEVDQVFQDMGASSRLYGIDEEKSHELKAKAAAEGVTFIRIKQRHMGSENTPQIIKNLADELKSKGIKFRFNTRIEDLVVEEGVCRGAKLSDGSVIEADNVILSPGRVGAQWADRQAQRHGIEATFGPIDVGVRVEVPAVIMEDVVSVNRDPKFHIRTHTYDDFVRTFCTNHHGYVVKETYDGFVGVNGHSMIEDKSGNTNFAFLVRITLTEPVEDTISYGESIAELATTIGGGKPVVQRLHDLRMGKRSHPNEIERNPVEPTLSDTTPGDISMALPHRVVEDILEGLEKLSKVIPGVDEDSTLLYAPEIKYYATRFKTDSRMQSNVKNLYLAGDGAGLSRDIVNASATGLLAADGVLKKK